MALRIEGLGERRGPASEARALFVPVDLDGPPPAPMAREAGEAADIAAGRRIDPAVARKSGTN